MSLRDHRARSAQVAGLDLEPQPFVVARLAKLSARVHERFLAVVRLEVKLLLRTGLSLHLLLVLVVLAALASAILGALPASSTPAQEDPDQPAVVVIGAPGLTLADLSPGEDVLDLGSGGGLDVLLSARRVGPTGTATGLDMTDEMLELARRNQAEAGIANARFVRGRIEAIPLDDASVDVVISNCVINLAGDKNKVLAEASRVLKPGGLFVLGDVIPRKVSALTDAMALLRFGSEEGFTWPALKGLVRTRFSNYWQLRKSLGLERYDEGEITAKIEAVGFSVQRARSNIGHNAKRMTFLAHAR